MNTPLISVIMPVYNAYETLTTAVASVINQSLQDWELILVDDGSTDRSLQLALSLASEDERIRVIAQENRGVSEARNLGAEMSRGALLAFLDADDAWRVNKLVIHHQLHQAKPSLDASFARIAFRETITAKTGDIKTFSSVPAGPIQIDQIIADNPVCTTSNLVVTRKAFLRNGGFEKGMNYAEDQEWLARLVASGGVIEGIAETLTDYRMSDDGLSADLEKMLAGWRMLAARYACHINVRQAEATYFRYLSRRALRTGGPASKAVQYAAKGFTLSPRGFMSDPRRGSLTLAGALAGMAMPARVRTRVFA